MRKNKDSAWRNFQKQPTTENMNYALSKEKLYSDEEYKLKLQYENKLTHNLKTNCKSFYSYLRNKRQLKTGVSTLVKEDGTEAETAREKAEFLAQAFSSVFVNEPKTTPDVEIPALSNDEMLTDVVISHADLKKELEGLNCFKSIGTDNIHPKFLRSHWLMTKLLYLLWRSCSVLLLILESFLIYGSRLILQPYLKKAQKLIL